MDKLWSRLLTIRGRIVISSVLLLAILGGGLWYLRDAILSERDAVLDQRKTLDRLADAHNAQRAFGDFRYWTMDLALTHLDSSNERATAARRELDAILAGMERDDAKTVGEIRERLESVRKWMAEAVDAYLAQDEVTGGLLVGKSRTAMAEAGDRFPGIITRYQKAAADANEQVVAAANRSAQVSLLPLLLAVVLGGGFVWFTARSVDNLMQTMSKAVVRMSEGDLTALKDPKGTDELADLLRLLFRLQNDTGQAIRSFGESAVSLAAASQELSASSQEMAATAQQTSSQAARVSTSAGEASKRSQSVSVAAEGLSESIREIASVANAAVKVAAEGTRLAQAANVTIAALDRGSAEIGDVTKEITSIAAQTNLLALNATIEAARAGEAGRGFAVVASEVKDLARQTAGATDRIAGRIDAIRRDVRAAIESLTRIASTIGQINEGQTRIAAAVEEQTSTARDIRSNVGEAAKAAADIASNVAGVATAAENTRTVATGTQTAAVELDRMAAELRTLVGRFRT